MNAIETNGISFVSILVRIVMNKHESRGRLKANDNKSNYADDII